MTVLDEVAIDAVHPLFQMDIEHVNRRVLAIFPQLFFGREDFCQRVAVSPVDVAIQLLRLERDFKPGLLLFIALVAQLLTFVVD